MRAAPTLAKLLFVAATTALVAACGNDQDSGIDVVAIGDPASLFEPGGRLPPGAQLLRGATAQGLVMLDDKGQVGPGIADRWIVTDDGMSYIFRLRDGRWSEGSKLSAETARLALMQAIAALRGAPLAKEFAGINDIRVMTGRVIEIRLNQPQPELLLLLAQPELGLLHRGRGAGPMLVRRDGKVAYLSLLEPEARGLPADPDWKEGVRSLRLRASAAEAAIARYNRGEANAVVGGRFEDFPLVDASGLSRGAIRLDPVLGLFGLTVVHTDGFLSSPANREAIAMAIDRDALIASLRVGGWAATTRIVPTGTEDADAASPERWSGMNLAERQSAAAARVARWSSGQNAPLTLRIALPQGPGADRLFTSLSGDLAKAGMTAKRVGMGDPADLRLTDAVARYPRAAWFLNQLSCEVQKALCSTEADALAARAAASPDGSEHAALLAEAEAKLTELNAYIPFGPPIRWALVRGNTVGFVPNRLGYHPLMPLALRPK